MAQLVSPAAAYKDSFIAALREFHREHRLREFDPQELERDFDFFLETLADKLYYPKAHRVPETVCWLVEGADFIGRVSIRHRLNRYLEDLGGHIGYEIRPTQRRRGYGTLILRLALEKAREIGLRRVLVTCDDDNIASYRIIEANGGVLQDVRPLPWHDVPVRRYWIDLA